MNRDEWKKIIEKSCADAGTYQPHFNVVIETLAGILEKRDEAESQFYASGGKPTIVHTNKAKERNIVKNPALAVYMDLNTQALAYWRDLGLTPSGLKKINGDALTAKATEDGFGRLLAKLNG